MHLYHHVPQDLVGSVIYPLNQLKTKFPDLYERHRAKYGDIQEKDVEIPGFALWNDCVNLMPVSPGLVKAELKKYGHDTSWPWRFYVINTENLKASDLIIITMTDANGTVQRTFTPFSTSAFKELCHIGEATRTAFREARERHQQPNTFARVPHVLYRNAIHVAGTRIVEF